MGQERLDAESFARESTVADVLEVFEESPVPILTAADVAAELGCSDTTARNRLEELVEDGRLYRKTAGARAVVYALLDDRPGRGPPNRP